MQIRISGRSRYITAAMKSYAEKKIANIDQYFDRVGSVQAVMDGEPGRFRVELVIHANRRKVLVSHAEKPKRREAVDTAVEKAERQLLKHKEKLKEKRK